MLKVLLLLLLSSNEETRLIVLLEFLKILLCVIQRHRITFNNMGVSNDSVF